MKKIILIIGILSATICCKSLKPQAVNIDERSGSEALYQYQWNLAELNGKFIDVPENQEKANLLFFPGKLSQVSGFTGCNKLKGSFELTGMGAIKFSPLITTKMACVGENVESKFLENIAKSTNWMIIRNELFLKNDETIVAKFTGIKPLTP